MRTHKSEFQLWLEGVPQLALATFMCATLGGFGLLFGAWLFVAILRLIAGLA